MNSPDIHIVDCEAKHIREMAQIMNPRTAETAMRLGLPAHKALWRSYKQSLYCKAAFINGKLAAIWGLGGVLFGETGQPWLVLSPEADEYPMRVAFIYKQELKKMQGMFPVLQDFVDVSYDKAVRLLELMGFKMEEQITRGDVKLYRAEKRSA